MAYGLKYTQYIEKGGALVRINVYEKDWTGGSYGMAHVVGASLQIIGGQSNVIAPIIKTAFSFSLVDAYDEGTPNSDGTTCINPDGEKCGQWEEFFTPDATKYKVEVTSKPAPGASESVIWTGFITPDSWSENMIYRGVITVTARDMIGALQEKEFDLTGRVSVRDLIAGAMSACECPMQLQLTEAHFLTNSNGNSILDHTFAASVFAGDTWYQALEDTLDSLGLVLRYNGANRIVLTSLRYIAGDTTRGSHEIEFVSRSGLRQLDPAIRSITETFDASLVRLAVDDPDPSQYTATGEYNVQRAPCSSSLPHDVNIPRYTLTGPIQPTEWLGSLAVPRPTQIYQGGGAIPEREIYFPTDIITEGVSATVQTNNIKAPFSFRINQDGPVMRYQVNGATTIVSALAKFQDIALSKIHVVVQASVDGQARYLGADGAWSTAQTIHEIDPGAEVVVPALSGGESFSIIITKLDTAYIGDWQLPVSTVVALNVELSPAQSSTTPTEFKTTTEYDQANNVVITRKPKIGSAGISSSAPFAENVLAYGDDLAADEWNWPGEESYYPLAVMIQAQVLCYYSAPASIFTGTAHDKAADVAAALPGYMFEYYDRDGVILSGTYGFTAGFISQINAREVYGWEDVWGAGFDPEYTAQSGAGKGSTSATGPGGGSASSGGASSTPAVGLNYFEPNEDRASLIQLKPAYDYLGPRKGLIFGETAEADVENSPAHLMLRNFGTAQNPKYALYTPFALVTGGDQIVINGEPGGGGGGGSSYLWELLDVDDNLQSPAAGALLQYDSVAGLWKGNAPATQIGAGVTGFTTGALIRSVLGDDFNAQWSVKQFINSSIATATATFRGTNTTATTEAAFLTWANGLTHDLNDYVFWKTTDSLGNTVYKRYKYDGSQWVFEYELNNSSFTSQQWDAINSGITSGKVGTYDTIAGYFSGGKILSTAMPTMYIGDAQVKFSAQTAQDVGGLGNLTMANATYLRAYNSARDTLYNLAGLNASNYGYLGAANSPRTYMRGQSLYFLSGNSGNTSALVISSSQNATFYGALYLQNNKQIYWKNAPAAGADAVNLGLLNLSSSNVFTLGSGLIATGDNARAYNTYIYGASLSFYTGNATTGAVRRWMINSSGTLYPYSNKEYNLGAAANYIKEAYISKIFLASGIYMEYNSTDGYVYINAPLVTNGDQIVLSGTPGGGGGGGASYLYNLLDVDDALISPDNGVVLQYNATAGKWKGVASDTIGITAAGSVADLNAASPSTAKKVWSPSVLASWLAGKNYVELNPGNVEQTISSNINTLDKGVVNLWRKSGNHYTFLGFSNGTTETFLGGLGFKSQSDNNLYHWIKSGASSSYYKILDENNYSSVLGSVYAPAVTGGYLPLSGGTMSGDLTLANNKNINAIDTGSTARSLLYMSNSNNLVLGGGTKDITTGGNTYIDGKTIRLYTPNAQNTWTVSMLVNGNQNITIGASDLAAANYKLYVNGDTYINGAIVSSGDQVVTSDIRMKKNLKPIELKVEDIAKCRAVSFDWAAGGHSFGSVAQDWEPLVPEAVKQGDIKTLAYGQAALVAAINIAKHDTEQDKEIRKLRKRVADLEKEVKRLRS